MKKIIFTTLCVLGLYSCGLNPPEVIDRPVFDVWSSSVLEIDKIEMSDSATVFYLDAFNQSPKGIIITNETYIRKSGSNERLLVTRAEGINLGEETNIPDSGNISFKLYFPPLKTRITKIDFIGGDCPDCYKIWGIYLLPNSKVKFDRIPKDVKKTSEKPLPRLEYSTEPAQISGRMLGYVKGMEPSIVTITALNILYIKKNETAFSIAENGSFSGEIIPGLSSIYESSVGPLFLTPGEETKIVVDLKKRSRFQSRYRTDKELGDSVYTFISGNFTFDELKTINQASINLNRAWNVMIDQNDIWTQMVNMNSEEFKQYVLAILNKRLDEIRQCNYSVNMQMMMENAIKMEVYLFMMQYEGLFIQANMRGKDFTTREEYNEERSRISSKMERIGVEYYSFLKDELNDELSYLPVFISMIEVFNDVTDFFKLQGSRKDYSAKDRYDYFKGKYESVMGSDKGLLYDMVQAMHYGWKLFDMEYFDDAEKQEVRDVFKDKPVYAEELIAESERMEAAMNTESKGVLNELPDVPQEQMLNAILAKYKGKVVVIDFWGTWCGPCITAMKSIQPLKDEMKGKDVVFLYMADNTSPLDAWTKMYPSISGEHYRVSEAQRIYWEQNLYPTYKIFDRQGKQIAKHVDFPGISVIKRDIENGLRVN